MAIVPWIYYYYLGRQGILKVEEEGHAGHGLVDDYTIDVGSLLNDRCYHEAQGKPSLLSDILSSSLGEHLVRRAVDPARVPDNLSHTMSVTYTFVTGYW